MSGRERENMGNNTFISEKAGAFVGEKEIERKMIGVKSENKLVLEGEINQ